MRALQDKGVFDTCDALNVKNIIWRPLGRSKTLERNWQLLINFANKYGKTQSQIILNWMCHLGYSPMVLSLHKKHIDENIDATDFVMSEADYRQMSDSRPEHYHPPAVHWDSPVTDDDIVTLVKDFDTHYGF